MSGQQNVQRPLDALGKGKRRNNEKIRYCSH